jgi:eukaryotic-like serine/threonine-protein kinase
MTAIEEQVRAIFLAALERAPDQWPTFLDEASGGNAEMRARVEQLLQSHQAMGSIHAGASTATVDQPVNESAGTAIGPYKLLDQIGEGGMGTVWMAQQTDPVKRLVAVKLIKAGMDSKQVVARFEAERQALALMDHPNIARVLDGGTTEAGRPYFVMDLVKGVPITRYCDDHHLTPRQRLELFVPVCQAVQHAHQKGVIHRDLKPSNVLVAVYDGRPVPKVIDFGVAKAAGQPLTDKTLVTGFGNIVGTLEYMSPEQAEVNQLDIDTRSDIYSLGVLLYELLAGSTPFTKKDLEKAGMLEMLRVIREQEPSKPSTKLSTADGLPTLAANRGTEPAKLTRLVRGELDWIVMKALEKDRNRRYETANGFAADVQRYLADETVQACPPSAAYRMRKFVRRHRGPVLGAAVIAVLLLGGIIGTSVGLFQAKRARGVAQANAERAEANFKEARTAVDDMYTQVAEKWLAQEPHLEAVQREFLEKALQFYERFAREYGSDPRMRLETDRAYRRIGEIQHKLGKTPQAERAFKRAAESLQELVDQFPEVPEYRQELADTLQKLGNQLGDMGSIPEAQSAHRRALNLQEKLAADFPAVPEYRRDLALGLYWIGKHGTDQRREPSDIEKPLRRSVALLEQLRAEFPTVTEYRAYLACSLRALGYHLSVRCHNSQGLKYQNEAIAVLEDLMAEFPRDPTYRTVLGGAYCWISQAQPSQEAEKSLRKALEVQRRLVTDFPSVSEYRYDVVRSLFMLANEVLDASRAEQAEQAYIEAVAIGEKLATESPKVHYYRSRLGNTYKLLAHLLRKTGKLPEAEKRYRQSITVFEQLIDDFPNMDFGWNLDDAYSGIGSLLRSAGRLEEEKRLFQEKLAELSKAIERNAQPESGQRRPLADTDRNLDYCLRLAECYRHLAEVLLLQGNPAASAGQSDKCGAEYTKAIELKRDDWRAWSGRAFVYFNRQQWDKAAADFSRAIELAPQVHTNWWHRGHAYLHLEQWDKAAADFGKVVDRWPDGVDGWYLRAFAFAQLKQPDKALADLRQAVAKGFNNAEQLKTDSRFASLRSREDFGKLLEELERKQKSKQK